MRSKSPLIRGIYAFEDEETPEWKEIVINRGLPKFATKLECEDFIKQHCTRGSNPDYPHLQHIFTNLIDWNQVFINFIS